MTTVKQVISFLDDMKNKDELTPATASVVKKARKTLDKSGSKGIQQVQFDIECLEADEDVPPTELTELWQVSHMLESLLEDTSIDSMDFDEHLEPF